MPILTKTNEYVIPLTFKCNWSCPYCAIRNSHDYKDNVSYDETIAKVDSVPAGSRVTLTGGEPGLVSKEHLEAYIDSLRSKNCELYLETNGLFIERYPDLCSCFYEILYHCSDNLDASKPIIQNGMENLRYLIVVSDGNFKNLDKFLQTYKDIKFDIIEATYPYKEEITGPTLSSANKHAIMAKYSKHMTKDSIKRMIREKDFDSITWMF